VLATLSRWRTWVQIPSGALEPVKVNRVSESARYANRQSGQAQTLVTCGFDSHSCQLASRVVFLTAACKAVAIKL
jgi:hypothetical protein